MAKMSLKNTKQEILDALHAAERKLKEERALLATPAETVDAEAEKTVVEAAEADVKADIFSDEMNAKFLNLQAAIEIQEKRLATCYGVERALVDMTVVVNASKQAQLAASEELATAKASAQAEIDGLRAQHEALKAELATTRKRESEEYEYNLNRERAREADAHADKVAAMNKDVAAIEARLAELRSDVAHIEDMEARMAGLAAELEAKFAEGFEAGKKEAGKDYGYKSSLAEKDHGYELRERDGKIQRLEAEVTAKDEKISSLEAKLDAAYSQLRDLASKTVESAGGVRVISATGDAGSGRK